VDGIGDGAGTPLGADLDLPSPAEVRLIDASLDTVAVGRPGQPGQLRKRPDRLIADRAYDGNVARVLLVRRGIEPIIPAQSNNRQATHQDGRRVRRYRQRWIVERTIGWLGNFRRLTVRYDRLLEAYSGFFPFDVCPRDAPKGFEMTSSMDGNKSMMLSVKNPFGCFVKYNIDMVDVKGILHHTSSSPVLARGTVYKSWPHPIPE
jgi:transposase